MLQLLNLLLQIVLSLLLGIDFLKIDLFIQEGHRLVELIITAYKILLSLNLHGLLIKEVLRSAPPIAGLPRLVIASGSTYALLALRAHSSPPFILIFGCDNFLAILNHWEDFRYRKRRTGVHALAGIVNSWAIFLLDRVVCRASWRHHGDLWVDDADIFHSLQPFHFLLLFMKSLNLLSIIVLLHD